MKDPREPIQPLLADDRVTEIMIDGWQKVYYEKEGVLHDMPTLFTSDEEVLDLINCYAEPLGRKVDASRPMVDIRVSDQMLVNAVIPPITLHGPAVTIRRTLPRGEINWDNLVKWTSISQPMIDFLRACVLRRLNIAVAGGTASGKTTFLRLLSEFIPLSERIIIVQSEVFPFDRPRMVQLLPRPADIEGRGGISMTDLIATVGLMRPDRILVPELLGGELYKLLGLMNNGHDGTMFSLHSNGVHDTLTRMETLAALGNPTAPLLVLREQIASAIDLILYQERLIDGTRKVMHIAEVTGMEEGVVTTRDLFEFRRKGMLNGRVQGYFTATGAIPSFFQTMQEYVQGLGIDLPTSLFTPSEN